MFSIVFYCFLIVSSCRCFHQPGVSMGFHQVSHLQVLQGHAVTPPHIQKTRPQFLEELLSLIKSNLTPQYCGKRNSKPAQYPTYLTIWWPFYIIPLLGVYQGHDLRICHNIPSYCINIPCSSLFIDVRDKMRQVNNILLLKVKRIKPEVASAGTTPRGWSAANPSLQHLARLHHHESLALKMRVYANGRFHGKMIEPSKQRINDDKCTFWDWRWIMVNQWIYGLSSRFSEPKLVANGWQNPWKGYGKKAWRYLLSLATSPSHSRRIHLLDLFGFLVRPTAPAVGFTQCHKLSGNDFKSHPWQVIDGLWQNESINIYIYI